jgi:hypothetical protein
VGGVVVIEDAVGADFDPDEDAYAAYLVAKERSEKLRAEWAALGSPATEMGGSTGKVLTEHPLLRAMRMAEAHEAKQREVVRRKYRGPDPRVVLGGPRSRVARLKGEPPRIMLHQCDEAG